MRIGILGANSEIAKDLIVNLLNKSSHKLFLYVREIESFRHHIAKNYKNNKYIVLDISKFNKQIKLDCIINFIGAGSPNKIEKLGSEILKITEYYDSKVIRYIEKYNQCLYIFISSGAVYGNNYFTPAKKNKKTIINISESIDWYGLSKIYAEAKHRGCKQSKIIDIRIFNYFSRTQSIKNNFLINDVYKSIVTCEKLYTNGINIKRDYLNPEDFYSLIIAALGVNANTSYDAYSKAPIDKLSLLNFCKTKYGLEFEMVDGVSKYISNRVNYYSKNKEAYKIGYSPLYDSLGGIELELECMIRDANG
jgi:nucleoside-diphosphate-sugar epimerase